MKYSLQALAAAALVALVTAAPANADDASFLRSIEKRGISGYTTPQQALELGHWMCKQLRAGRNKDVVYSELVDFTYYEAHIYPTATGALGQLVGAAWNNLCPEQDYQFVDREVVYLSPSER